jgi:hypothetical protein
MNSIDKIRVLLPHWIQHNQGHRAEFLQWAASLSTEAPELAALLQQAAEALQSAQASLEAALDRAGGPLASSSQGHCHHH